MEIVGANMNDNEPAFNLADEDSIPEPPEMDDVPSIHDDDYDDDNYPKADGDVDDETCIHDDYPDDDMDGDAESPFTSCGWGTDESYGYYGDE